MLCGCGTLFRCSEMSRTSAVPAIETATIFYSSGEKETEVISIPETQWPKNGVVQSACPLWCPPGIAKHPHPPCPAQNRGVSRSNPLVILAVSAAELVFKSVYLEKLMKKRMTWDKIKRRFPNEWLLIVDYDTDESGHIRAGTVARHSRRKAFKYTGDSTFPGNWRAHAEHHHF